MQEFDSPGHRDTTSSNANKFNLAIDEENIDFNISGVPNAMVKRSHSINVHNLSQQIENHLQRQALQSDLQQHRAFNPFSGCCDSRRFGHDGDAELVPSTWKDSGLGSPARKPWAPSQGPSKRFGVWDPQENPGHRPKNRFHRTCLRLQLFSDSHIDNVVRTKKKSLQRRIKRCDYGCWEH